MAPISADKRENSYLSTNPSSQQNERTSGELCLYNGSYHFVFKDNANGGKEYILDEKGNKLYREDIAVFQMQDSTIAKRKQAQNNTLNFFAKQEKDYSDRSTYYDSLVKVWTAKLIKNQSIYNLSKNVVEAKDDALDPLYVKYNTFDISKFSDNKDKKLGFKLWGERKSAKHDGNVAFSLAQFEKTVINEYKESASFSDFCSKQIAKMQLNCLKDIIMG